LKQIRTSKKKNSVDCGTSGKRVKNHSIADCLPWYF
jgi:hypothetical protein